MREFLNPLKNGGYELSDTRACVDSIEVPDGAGTLAGRKSSDVSRYFWSNENKAIIGVGESFKRYPEWTRIDYPAESWLDSVEDDDFGILWQRSKPVDAEFELPSIESTLSERQGEYGEFSDVAETTQKLMSFVVGLDYSHVQLEALHMICSKLARIKHGDSKKIDTWHDIAGYATLVVNDLSK